MAPRLGSPLFAFLIAPKATHLSAHCDTVQSIAHSDDCVTFRVTEKVSVKLTQRNAVAN